MPIAYLFRASLVAKIGKRSNGCLHWDAVKHGAIILTKCKLLNVILDQLMDCNVIKDDYSHIAVHKLDQNNVEKLKFD